MDEPEFQTITKYLGGLKQELQDKIVDAIWDMGTVVTREKKLKEPKQRLFLEFRISNLLACKIDQAVLGLKASRKHKLVVVRYNS